MPNLTDFHSHVLPGIDDGSSSVEESIAMLKLEAGQGIKRVVATPHFYAQRDKLEEFLMRRDEAEKRLRKEMAKVDNLPEIHVGAEVSYFRGMSQCEYLPQLTVQGTRHILIEMPFAPWTGEMYRELEEVWRLQKLIPIIAHIDRYISPVRNHDRYRRLAELPVLVQANGDFFLRRSTKRMAFQLLQNGYIHLLGSDCHNMCSRKPNMGMATEQIQRKSGPEALLYIRKYEQQVFLGIDTNRVRCDREETH